MPGPTDLEQLLLELVNETRLDPMGAASLYITSYSPLTSSDPAIQQALNAFNVDGAALLAAYSALQPVKPLAWNDALGSAAETHSAAMIANLSQTHQAPGEASLGTRITAAGYTNWTTLGENIYAYAESVLYAHAGFMVDWGPGPNGMQDPAGHRINLMSSAFSEIGIDVTAYSNTTVNPPFGPLVVTEDLGSRNKKFVLGVAYTDTNHDAFYSVGEGRSDLVVQVGSSSTTSTSSGGYTLEATGGSVNVTLSGGGLSGPVTVTGDLTGGNLKLDVVDGMILRTSGSVSVSGPVSTVVGISAAGVTIGTGAGDQTLIGTFGNDQLDGGAGADHLYGGVGNDSYFVDQQGDLVFEDFGGGTDMVTASASFYLYDNIEGLALATSAGDAFGVGNELDNLMFGNDGQNLLIGWDGADEIHGGGARDAIFGVDGNDHLYGDAGIDYIVAGIGDDYVDGGADEDEIYGQDGNDTLIGGADFKTDIIVGGKGDDIIHGDSGLGEMDWLYGNEGNDTFYVDTPFDLVFEQPGEGIDTVYAGITGAGYYLYDNIENLVLTGNTPFGVGNALDNTLTGSDLANWLLGGAGNDTINGKGGNDVLFGESGADTFVFEANNGADVIGDFTPDTDKIDLSALHLSWATVQASMHDGSNAVAIDLGGGNLVVINGHLAADLHQADFLL